MARRKRDYKAEYRRRQELARMRGSKGYWQQRTTPRKPTGDQLTRVPEQVRDARRAALSVIHLARDSGFTVEQAARLSGVPMEVVRWYARDALRPTRGGQTLPTKSDRLQRLRPIYVEGATKVQYVVARGSNEADRLDHAFRVQYDYMHGNATDAEVRGLSGQRAGSHRVEADPSRLDVIAALGEPNPDEVYRELVS
jgi:hypothetical protein